VGVRVGGGFKTLVERPAGPNGWQLQKSQVETSGTQRKKEKKQKNKGSIKREMPRGDARGGLHNKAREKKSGSTFQQRTGSPRHHVGTGQGVRHRQKRAHRDRSKGIGQEGRGKHWYAAMLLHYGSLKPVTRTKTYHQVGKQKAAKTAGPTGAAAQKRQTRELRAIK